MQIDINPASKEQRKVCGTRRKPRWDREDCLEKPQNPGHISPQGTVTRLTSLSQKQRVKKRYFSQGRRSATAGEANIIRDRPKGRNDLRCSGSYNGQTKENPSITQLKTRLESPQMHSIYVVRISLESNIRVVKTEMLASATTTSGAYSTSNACLMASHMRFACRSDQKLKSSGSRSSDESSD